MVWGPDELDKRIDDLRRSVEEERERIKDVPVAKCEWFYGDSNHHYCMIGAHDTHYYNECDENPDCYYKQLQQLKVEHEELKEKIKTYEKMFDNEEFRVALTDIRTGERELWQKYKPRMLKAEKCLGEIEEIASRNISYMDTNSTTRAMEKILQLIKQAKEGE